MSKSYNYQPAGTTTVTTTGNIAQLDPQGNSVILMNNASLSTIQGIKAGYPGQKVTIISIGAGEVDLVHQNGSASANDRLINYVTSGITPLAAGVGTCQYQYDDITNRWRLINHNQGALINIPFSSGNFFPAGGTGGTWTVSSGNITTLGFLIHGNYLLFEVIIVNTSITVANPQSLNITLPNSYTTPSTAHKRQVGEMVDVISGTPTGVPGFAANGFINNSSVAYFANMNATNWSLSSSSTGILTSIDFAIN